MITKAKKVVNVESEHFQFCSFYDGISVFFLLFWVVSTNFHFLSFFEQPPELQALGVEGFDLFGVNTDIIFLAPDPTIRTTTVVDLAELIYNAHISLVHHDWVVFMNTLITRKLYTHSSTYQLPN